MELIESKRDVLATVLPKHVSVDRLVKVTMMAISRSPDLMACDVATIYRAIWQASELGLDIAGPLPQCYLIPRKNKHRKDSLEATFLIGYGGLLKLAQNHRDVEVIRAELIYRGEKFVHDKVSGKLIHEGSLEVDTKDENLIGAWACAWLRGGHTIARVLPRREIDQRRKRSAASDSGPWKTDYAAQCRKTALRALLMSRLVPMSVELMDQIEREQEIDGEELKAAEPVVVRRGITEPPATATENVLDPFGVAGPPDGYQQQPAQAGEEAEPDSPATSPAQDPLAGESTPPDWIRSATAAVEPLIPPEREALLAELGKLATNKGKTQNYLRAESSKRWKRPLERLERAELMELFAELEG
jgi:recombination protein RecT